MNTNVTDSGFDLLITDLGSKFAVTIGSKKGKDLLEKYADTKEARSSDIKKISKSRKNIAKKYIRKVKIPKEEWSKYLVSNFDNTIWEERSNKCLESQFQLRLRILWWKT